MGIDIHGKFLYRCGATDVEELSGCDRAGTLRLTLTICIIYIGQYVNGLYSAHFNVLSIASDSDRIKPTSPSLQIMCHRRI
jgi:hypothetical protein